jgi:hypothetical protein
VLGVLLGLAVVVIVVLVVVGAVCRSKKGEKKEELYKVSEMTRIEKKEEKEEEEVSFKGEMSSKGGFSTDLLAPEPAGPSFPTASFEPSATEKEEEREREREREKEKEKEIEKQKIEKQTLFSTVTITYLVEGFSCVPPYGKTMVDVRDSFGYEIRIKGDMRKRWERRQLGVFTVYWVAHVGVYLLETSKCKGGLRRLSPFNMLFSEKGIVCVLDVDEGGVGVAGMTSTEWKRWQAPELLKGNVKEANEKTVCYTVSLCLYACLMAEFPFQSFDPAAAGRMLGNGKRPEFEFMEKEERAMEKLIESCWEEDVERRKELREFELEIVVYAPNGIFDDNGFPKGEREMKGEESEEGKEEKGKEGKKEREEEKGREGEEKKEEKRENEGDNGKGEKGKGEKGKKKKGKKTKGKKGKEGEEGVQGLNPPKEPTPPQQQ